MIRRMRRMNESMSEDFDFSIFKKSLGNGTFSALDYAKHMLKDDTDITYYWDSEYQEIMSKISKFLGVHIKRVMIAMGTSDYPSYKSTYDLIKNYNYKVVSNYTAKITEVLYKYTDDGEKLPFTYKFCKLPNGQKFVIGNEDGSSPNVFFPRPYIEDRVDKTYYKGDFGEAMAAILSEATNKFIGKRNFEIHYDRDNFVIYEFDIYLISDYKFRKDEVEPVADELVAYLESFGIFQSVAYIPYMSTISCSLDYEHYGTGNKDWIKNFKLPRKPRTKRRVNEGYSCNSMRRMNESVSNDYARYLKKIDGLSNRDIKLIVDFIEEQLGYGHTLCVDFEDYNSNEYFKSPKELVNILDRIVGYPDVEIQPNSARLSEAYRSQSVELTVIDSGYRGPYSSGPVKLSLKIAAII